MRTTIGDLKQYAGDPQRDHRLAADKPPAMFEPTTNNIVRDATTLFDMRQQPTEDTSSVALRWRESLLLLPTTNKMELDKWLFIARLKPTLREPLLQQLGASMSQTPRDKQPSWHKIVTMAQNIEAATTLPVEMARVQIQDQQRQWRPTPQKEDKQQNEGACWRCGGPHRRATCKFPPNICCTSCGRMGHMKKVCRHQKMKSGRPSIKQQGKPKQFGAAAAVAGTPTTTSMEDEASWDAALKVGVHLIDTMKPTMTMLVVALIMACIPTIAATPTQLKETTVFLKGLTLCEPPMGGGHLMALPPMPDCHKSRAQPVDNVVIRLLVRQHKIHRGELYAMQRIKTTRCTHLSWFLYTTIFPDQVDQGALQHDEMQMIEDAMAETRVDPSRRPPEFRNGELRFQREADMDVWTT